MILVTLERIYGIDVHTFTTTTKQPYQLTFEKSLDDKNIDVCLVNLLGNERVKSCPYMWITIKEIILSQLNKTSLPLYFNINIQSLSTLCLLRLLLMKLSNSNEVKTHIEVTNLPESMFVEFYIKKNPAFTANLEVE